MDAFNAAIEEIRVSKNGISGKKIKHLTDIARQFPALYTEFVPAVLNYIRSASASHKLGALYVLDSIARGFHEDIKAGKDATGDLNKAISLFAASLKEVIEIAHENASEEHKEKIVKLLEIWRKTGTFDNSLISSVRLGSTTPTVPPPSLATPAVPTASQANDLLKQLASMGGAAPPPPPGASAPGSSGSSVPSLAQAPALPNLSNLATADPAQQQAALFQMLQAMQSTGQIPPMPQPPLQPSSQQPPQELSQQDPSTQSRWARGPQPPSQQEAFNRFRQQDGGSHAAESFRERQSGFSRRDRDRSPRRPVKDRAPPGHVIGEVNLPGTPHFRERNVSFDQSLPAGSIKVLSRTLFIGGVPAYMNQEELAAILRPYAEVQSVILNAERKHAFVKVYSRKEAEMVVSSFNKNGQYSLRTRWGVGFGPRDCCDYQHGMSIIPIARLTDADRRWINEAQWGGIGTEQQLVPGLIMEEPDIEIGEGVSSKAISQKMPTDGSRNGPRSTKPGEPDDMYTDPIGGNQLPSFMQGGKSDVLSNLFGGNGAPPQQGPPAPAPVQAPPAPAAQTNEQLSQLLSFLNQQQK